MTLGRTLRRVGGGVLCAALFTSCAISKETRDQILGGAGGAALGAAVGALASGGDPKAIAAGAVAGAVVGWATVKLVQYHAEKTRSAAEEAKVLGYNGQGTMVTIREASVSPGEVRPGDDVNLAMDYAVLAPSGTAVVPVQETWVLEKDGKELTRTSPQLQDREPGGWHTQAAITLPKQAPAGTYIVKNQVSAAGNVQERVAYFTVLATS
jgi:outer membrane lipoprotein SlyB